MENPEFLGIGWAFPPHFEKQHHNGTVMVQGDKDIQQSLTILLSTIPGERIFRFDYGCNIKKWVFAKMSLSEKTLIRDILERAIINGEPRITIESLNVTLSNVLEGVMNIDISYIVKATNSRKNMVYPFYFKEGTQLERIPERN